MTRELLIVAMVIPLYFYVRELIDGRESVAFDHADTIIRLEQSFGIFVEPSLQSPVVDQGWAISAVNAIYIYGHLPVLVLTAIWLMVRHPTAYTRYRNAILISGGIALLFYSFYPLAPPRFLEAYGFVDTVTDHSSAYRVLQPPEITNQYAAMPSMHFGWSLINGIAWATVARQRWARLFGWLLPPLMFVAIVLTANHYIVDGVVGGAVAMVGIAISAGVAFVAVRWARSMPWSAPVPLPVPLPLPVPRPATADETIGRNGHLRPAAGVLAYEMAGPAGPGRQSVDLRHIRRAPPIRAPRRSD